jgi:hypothetical protein
MSSDKWQLANGKTGMQYQNLTLRTTEFDLQRGADGRKLASFKLHVDGVYTEPLERSFDWGALIELRQRCASTTARWEDAMALGQALADVLLPDEVRRVLIERRTQMQAQNKGLRLQLGLTSDLHRLPWEFLALNRAGGEATLHDFLALDKHISVVRQPATTLPIWEIAPQQLETVQVLAALASPADQPKLDIAREQATLQKVFGQVPNLQPTLLLNATAGELLQGTTPVHVFHFAGHGQMQVAPIGAQPGKAEAQGVLLFEDHTGYSAPLDAATLSVVLRQRGVRVAVLGACHSAERDDVNQWSGVAESLLKAGLGAAVGMQFAVKDESAISFVHKFYEALLAGLTIDEAVCAGRVAIAAQPDPRGLGTPVLYLRDSGSNGVVFPEVAQRSVAAQDRLVREVEAQRTTIIGTQTKIERIDLRGSQGAIVNNSGTITQNFNVSPVEADAEIGGATPEAKAQMQKLYEVLGGFWFSTDDLEDLCFRMGTDWDNLSGDAKKGKARAFVHYCFKEGRLAELMELVRAARPKLEW